MQALQSTVLPERFDIGRPELKVWDGIPGHTFRLPPYFWPHELKDRHLDGEDRPFAVDIRRIPVNPPNDAPRPQPNHKFRPTRRLNTVFRDRTKGPQNPKRSYNPAVHSPGLKSKHAQGSGQLGGDSEDDDPPPPSFLQDEFEYDMVGDIWGPVGGFEGRDYDSERLKDHERWYRYFLVNTDPWERTIVVNGVQVAPGAVAGPLPPFAMFELGDQAAFWFGVGGRDYDPNTTSTPDKRVAENDAPGDGNRVKSARTVSIGSPGQETGGSGAAGTTTQPGGEIMSPVTRTITGIGNLQLGQPQNQPQNQARSGGLRGTAPEFVPGAFGGLERLGLRGGAGTEADIDPVGADEATQRTEAAMEEAALQKEIEDATADELMGDNNMRQGNTGTAQNTSSETTQNINTETSQNVSTRTPYVFGTFTKYNFTTVDPQDMTAGIPRYMSGETPPYMSTGALESRLERLGVCVDPSWDRERLLNELLKVKMLHCQFAHKVERANSQIGAPDADAERGAQARAERMMATISEHSELEQRHMCEGFGIIIRPEWIPARIRQEIVRLYETAYQELLSNNNAKAEYEAAMGLLENNTDPKEALSIVEVLFFLASRYMYRQRSGPELKALCEKYCFDIHRTWDSERVIIEIMRAIEWQRQLGRARKETRDASIAASIAAIAAMDAETAFVRAKMAEMANSAKAKKGPTVIDLTLEPTLIDLTHSP